MDASKERGLPIVLGTRIEQPGVNLLVAAPLLFAAHSTVYLKAFDISGAENLPEEGPCVVTSTHTSALQTLLLPEAIMMITGRSVAMVAGHTKLFPKALEDPNILAKTGEKPYEEKSLLGKVGAEIRGYLLREIGILPIHRGEAPYSEVRSEMQNMLEVLDRGEILGLFMNMSRTVPDIYPGVVMVARRFPEVPVVPAFTDGKLLDRNPFQAAFGKPRFFREYNGLPKREKVAAMTQDLDRDIFSLQRQVTERQIRRLLNQV